MLSFVARCLWDPIKRAEDPIRGAPVEVEARLRLQRLCVSTGHMPSGLCGAG